jgi:hypothetical protein
MDKVSLKTTTKKKKSQNYFPIIRKYLRRRIDSRDKNGIMEKIKIIIK